MQESIISRYNGISEEQVSTRDLKVGDVFRRQGSTTWWKVTSDPVLLEEGVWSLSAQATTFLLG